MKFERAKSMSNLPQDEDDEVGLTREERLERREERRKRRRARRARRIAKREERREERLAKKAEKLRQKAEKLEEKSKTPRRRRSREDEEPSDEQAPARRRPSPREPARSVPDDPPRGGGERRRHQGMRPGRGPMPNMPHFPEGQFPDGYLPDDGFIEDGDRDMPPMEPWETELRPLREGQEDLGWSFPHWRRQQVPRHHPPVVPLVHPAPRAVVRREPETRVVAAHAPSPQLPAPWSPPARMGQHLRIQASNGHRAAVIELKPGLFVVADIPEALAKPELGFAPILAPLIVRAASKAMKRKEGREVQEGVQPQVVYVQVPAQHLALPGPVEVESPRVAAWADAEDLAGVLAESAPRR